MSNYPTVRPSLTLDFQKSKQLDPRISFSRSSSATYVEGGVVKYADEHQARFEEEGLLIEESRTNIFDQSEDVEAWSSGLWTKTNNVAISPDGTQTAGSLVPNIGTTSQASGRTVTQSAGNHVCSVFAKPNGLTALKLRFSGSSYQAFFNLTGNGSVASQSNGTASISKRPDGWYKCVFVINDSVGETAAWQLGHNDNSNVDGTNGFYIWGMQVEAGTFPTSYIPTSGSTVTRSQDIAQITGDNFNSWYNQSEGTLYYQYSAIGGNQFLSPASIRASNSQDAQSWGYWMYTGGSQYRVPNAGQRKSPNEVVFLADGNAFTSTIMGQSYKVAVGHDNSTLSACLEGYSVQSRTITSLPTMTQFSIGFIKNNSNNKYTGHIARIAYYSRRLTNLKLETLTL